MGVIIDLKGPDFDKTKWRRELGNVFYTHSTGDIMPFCMVLQNPDEVDLILFDDEPDRPATPDAEVWILPVGGIRGVTVRNDPDGIVLSMPAMTGARDWKLAEDLTDIGVTCGATVEVDGEPVPTDGGVDLTRFYQELWQLSVASVRHQVEHSDSATVPVLFNYLHLDLTTEQLDSPTLHDDLVARMGRFGVAHTASDMVIAPPGGGEMTINVAGAVPTLVNREADAVMLYDEADDLAAEGKPVCDGKPIPMARFIDIMGDRLESAGPLVYVPTYKYSEMPDILGKLKAAAAAPSGVRPPTGIKPPSLPGAGGPGPNQNTLAQGPVIIFLLVAAADGKIDEKETTAFREILENSTHAPGAVFQKMLRDAREGWVSLMVDITTNETPPQMLLVRLLQALDECPEEESRLARQGLYKLAHTVASASGGFLGFGSKISRSERQALDMLQNLLGVNPDEFMQD